MRIVDTNILAYLLLETDDTGGARRLFTSDPVWRSEEFILIEFTNVLSRYVAQRHITLERAQNLFSQATTLLEGRLVQIPNAEALAVAVEFGITAYDARFIAAARLLGQRVVTQDKRLRAAAPTLTQSLDEALALI